MILVDTDLGRYADLANACWVQDAERVAELYERDVTALPQAFGVKSLRVCLHAFVAPRQRCFS